MTDRKLPGPVSASFNFRPSEITSLIALKAGTADAHQQREAWKVIVEALANVSGSSFTMGSDGQRVSDFNEGRRWVGRALELAVNVPIKFDSRGEPPPIPEQES